MRSFNDSVFGRREAGGSQRTPISSLGDGGDVETGDEVLDALQQTLLDRVDRPAVDFLVNVRCWFLEWGN